MLRKAFIFLMVFACGLFLSKVWAQGVEDVHVKVKTGVHGAGVDAKTKVKVGEYDVLDVGAHPDFSFSIDGKIEGTYFSGGGTYYEDEDQAYHANIDMQRYVSSEFSYHRFWHWLDHDPLTNLYAAAQGKPLPEGMKPAKYVKGKRELTSNIRGTKYTGTHDVLGPIPPFVTYTDYNAGREYGIMRSEMESKTTARVPMELPIELKTFFNYRKEVRRGEKQALTMSKCSACHVVSHTKIVNEYIEDYNPGFIVNYRNGMGRFSVSYEYLDRKFGENSLPPENYYDRARRPGSHAQKPEWGPSPAIFDARVHYQDETHPYAELPRSRKWSHKAKGNAYFPSVGTGLFVSGIYSGTENKEEDLRFNLKSIFSRLSNSMIPGLALNVHFRWLDLANEAADTSATKHPRTSPTGGPDANPETPTIEGYPEANITYGQHYPGWDPDFIRESAMSRDEWEVGFDGSYLLMRGVTLRGSYKWRQISRDLDELYTQGDDDTEEHIAKVGINARFTPPIIRKPIRARLTYKYESIAHPFANVNGAFRGEEDIKGLGGFGGTQYWELQGMRNVTLTNLPTRTDEVRFDTTVPILDRLSITGFYRFIKEENDLVGWKNWTHMPSVSLWYAPFDKLNFTVSYLYRHGKTSTLLCEPIYNG